MAGGALLALLRVSVLVVVRFAFAALEVALVVALVANLVIARIVYILPHLFAAVVLSM
jgi:hypothetical protein